MAVPYVHPSTNPEYASDLKYKAPYPEEECTHPIISATSALMALQAEGRELNRKQIHESLELLAMQVLGDNFEQLEVMLAVQAQVLHRMFTYATEKLAGKEAHPKNPYATIALKAQSYCRQTIAALVRVKQMQALARERQSFQKPRNGMDNSEMQHVIKELYGRDPHRKSAQEPPPQARPECERAAT
jgi:hypothetical protein